jgi:hypothetical protein
MCKKRLFFIIFSVLAFSVFVGCQSRPKPRPFPPAYGKEINSRGTITIIKYTGLRKEISIPENFDIKRPKNTPPPVVDTIGKDAFIFKRLTRVFLPNRLTVIEDWAFSNNELTNVIIPNAVTTIGEGAFAFNQLKTVTLPNNNSFVVGDLAFYNNELTGITWGKAATGSITIGHYAFADNLLIDISLPDAVSSIGDWAFYNNKLANVVISNNVSSIGEGVFAANDLSGIVIPDSVTSIGNYAFASNIRLKEITIGRAVSSIGDWAFDYDFTAGYYKNGRQAGTY